MILIIAGLFFTHFTSLSRTPPVAPNVFMSNSSHVHYSHTACSNHIPVKFRSTIFELHSSDCVKSMTGHKQNRLRVGKEGFFLTVSGT